ncbi:3,4-dihydroxyphenylacetate 2,3-dioxygenase [Emcibacter nanhaiensis]|uniref:3,4-dihydroxyphenylacetate 2,3-dioxygenase n=1 Tax=Emcibacter nanhaiensis TaxID=1505037 RepID=A0A501PIC1_9PROT|nr:3,4-dihydroxyphenylacetate 2,3-dioxygenase [Emcibacter nanhaiensis]TPD59808.1 3,4-dihydroxyphenylacetate 2,3-dioxygenase [Emcibacter nanhaiensis]
MGEVALAAKICHVPTIWMSEMIEGFEGIRQFAIDGLKEIGRRAEARGVDTFILCDTHWLVNQGFHVNGRDGWSGTFTSHELPHMLNGLEYDYSGDPELGDLIAEEGNAAGLKSRCHKMEGMNLEYGTLIPMRHANHFGAKVLPIAANQFSSVEENRIFGAAVRRAVEKSGRRVAFLASGSLSHEFAPNHISQEKLNDITDEFHRQVDLRVMQLWTEGQIEPFLRMLPTYVKLCQGEGAMADTSMLFGLLGWDQYRGKGEVICDYFPSSGTGQTIVEFPL